MLEAGKRKMAGSRASPCHDRCTARVRRQHWSASRSEAPSPLPARALSSMLRRTLRSSKNFPLCQVVAESSSRWLGGFQPCQGGSWMWGDCASQSRWRGAPGRGAAQAVPTPRYRPPSCLFYSRTPKGGAAAAATERAAPPSFPPEKAIGPHPPSCNGGR